MKKVRLVDVYDNEIVVNEDNVTHIASYTRGVTLVYFNCGIGDQQAKISVKGSVSEIAGKFRTE